MKRVFVSYSHVDESLRSELDKHLAMLKHQGRIDVWNDRRIEAGDRFEGVISDQLEQADIILLLVSSDFLASAYCYGIEMARAMQRADEGGARVIPIILRACVWQDAPFGKLLAAPRDGKPVTKWTDRDEAWTNVVQMITSALPAPTTVPGAPHRAVAPERSTNERDATSAPQSAPRSSNLGIRQEFSEAQRARFARESFEFMARFFENSLDELQRRNLDIEVDFTRVDSNQFTAAIFRGGKSVANCRIRFEGGGRALGSGILFSYEAHATHGNSYNESLSVEADEQTLFLKALGMASGYDEQTRSHLSQEGAAEYYWWMLIKPLQR